MNATSDDHSCGADADQPRRTIAVFGAHSIDKHDDAYRLAYDIGSGLAGAGFEVLSGGYGGVMEAVSAGARAAGGTTIGVTCPTVLERPNASVRPNAFLDEVLPAPDMLARIDTMMRLSGGCVVMDGGTGTLCELAVAWEFVGKAFITPRPIVLVGRTWDAVSEQMRDHRPDSVAHVHRCSRVDEIVAVFEQHALTGTHRADDAGRLRGGANDANTTVTELRQLVDQFVRERSWYPFHDPKNLSASIAIEAAELMEHFQWLRSDQLEGVRADDAKMAAIGEELADILAYVLSFADTMNIDLSTALARKMIKNAQKYPADDFQGRFE